MSNEINEKLNELLGISGVDFFAPNNFVKLIELQVTKKLIVGRYFQGSGEYRVLFSNQWYDRESFFTMFIDFLQRADEFCIRKRNQIIRKIQETDWNFFEEKGGSL